MNRLEIDVKIENGWYALKEFDIQNIKEFCSNYEGKEVDLIFKKKESRRTVAANAYYWGVIIKAFQRLWMDIPKDEIHRILGEKTRKFRRPEAEIQILKKVYNDHNERFIESDEWYIKSSSDMSTYEFWLMCEQSTVLLMDMGGNLTPIEAKQFKDTKEMFDGGQGKLFEDKKIDL